MDEEMAIQVGSTVLAVLVFIALIAVLERMRADGLYFVAAVIVFILASSGAGYYIAGKMKEY